MMQMRTRGIVPRILTSVEVLQYQQAGGRGAALCGVFRDCSHKLSPCLLNVAGERGG
jgi:hypothetical protein